MNRARDAGAAAFTRRFSCRLTSWAIAGRFAVDEKERISGSYLETDERRSLLFRKVLGRSAPMFLRLSFASFTALA